MASLSLRSIELFAESKMRKQERVYMSLHEGNGEKCLKICEFLSLTVCSLILVENCDWFHQYNRHYIPQTKLINYNFPWN